MTNFIKKLFTTINLLSVITFGYAYGDDGKDAACCKPVCCLKGFISADLLYWRAFESGLDICVPEDVSDQVTYTGRVISKFRGKGKDPHFNWNPGFRIGAGFDLGSCGWDIAAFWTHYHSHVHGSKHRRNALRWNLDFDVVDIVTGYESDLANCFTLRPFLGLRLARIDQKVRIGERHHFSSKVNKEDFSGIGPLLGLEVNWDVGCDFSLYVNGSVSWLYGRFDVKLLDSGRTEDTETFCRVSKHLDANVAAADAGLGIRWQRCFCGNKRFLLQLGLEHHRYFDYNRTGHYGDLSFDGVNFSAGIEF